MSVGFGEYEGQAWYPSDRQIDWVMNYDRLFFAGAVEAHKPVGFDSGDGLTCEIHQDNCSIYYNHQAPYMDMVAVNDPRDNLEYTWFREDNPDGFESLVKFIGHAALVHNSRFPIATVEAVYLDRRSTGIDPKFLEEPRGF